MSYWTSLHYKPEGDPEGFYTDGLNVTWNVLGMYSKAVGYQYKELSGRIARDVIEDLKRAIECMETDPATYDALAPSNGWGSRTGFIEHLRALLEQCEAHPSATVDVS